MIWMFAAVVFASAAAWVLTGPPATVHRLGRSRAGSATIRAFIGQVPAMSWRPGRAARRDRLRRAAIVELCQAFGAELGAGRTPAEALERAAGELADPLPVRLRPAVLAACNGGDVAGALIRAAAEPGFAGLVRLAASWKVGVATGAGLSQLVERVAVQLRDEEVHRQEVAAQLAGPKATVRLLAALPVLGLLLASGLGMAPLDFFVSGPLGVICAVLGVGLDGVGLWWTQRMVVAAERTGTGGA